VRRSAVGRAFALVLVALVGSLLAAAPASAHSAANTPASNYVSAITSVSPAPRTFSVRVIEAGSRLELRWRSGADILVPDYDGHPYLRIGRDGVQENQQSNAVYLNRSRLGSTAIPDGLRPDGPPEWKRIATEPVARWHDHRIHWMSSALPPQVAGRTDQRSHIQGWDVPLTQGSTTYHVNGVLSWVPGPSPLPYLGVSAVLAAALIGLAIWSRSTAAGVRRACLAAVPALVVLVAADAVHLAGIAFGIRSATGTAFGRLFTVGYVSIAGWVLSVIAVVLLVRRRADALYLVTFAAGLMFVVGGLADYSVLSRTSVPFAFPVGVARWCIAVTLGMGLGLGVAGVLLTRPLPRALDPATPDATDPATPDAREPAGPDAHDRPGDPPTDTIASVASAAPTRSLTR
jgi:hypothetical protein